MDESVPAGAGKTALIVDDSPSMLERTAIMLRRIGFKTIATSHVYDALEIPAREQVDVIILDVEMPGLTGFQLCDRLREQPQSEHIPIVFLSVRNEYLERIRGFSAGAQAYVAKDYIDTDFVDAVVRVVRKDSNACP